MKLKRINHIVLSLACILAIGACSSKPQPRAYVSELTSNDSMIIQMGQWHLIKYHSDKLGMDINYPSFLIHQELPGETSQEIFIKDDISISVIVDSLSGMNYSAGQQMMGMGADLVEATDHYSIQTGVDEKWEYYGKVIDDDTIRIVTVMLRYLPEHDEAVEPLRDWVHKFDVTSSSPL
ncbi:MAG: hypothetical protein IJ618_10160 [Prevotella sp.]|nr:hypothetical protein [Prevotella sp.]